MPVRADVDLRRPRRCPTWRRRLPDRRVSRESVLIVRSRDGALRAFLNVCRHRGACLSLEPCGNTGPAIQCVYHAWSYALEGRLIGAPIIARDESILANDRCRQPQDMTLRHWLALRLIQVPWDLIEEKRCGRDLRSLEHFINRRVHAPSHRP